MYIIYWIIRLIYVLKNDTEKSSFHNLVGKTRTASKYPKLRDGIELGWTLLARTDILGHEVETLKA